MFCTKEWVKDLLSKVLRKTIEISQPISTKIVENANITSSYEFNEIYSKTFDKDELLNVTYIISFVTNNNGGRGFRAKINGVTFYQQQMPAPPDIYAIATIPVFYLIKAGSKFVIEVQQNSGTTLSCNVKEQKIN